MALSAQSISTKSLENGPGSLASFFRDTGPSAKVVLGILLFFSLVSWLIIIATLPAVLIGLVLEKAVRGLFASPLIAAVFLIVNGFLLLVGDRLRDRASEDGRQQRLSALGWRGGYVGSAALRCQGRPMRECSCALCPVSSARLDVE